jgi:hypothetical protein
MIGFQIDALSASCAFRLMMTPAMPQVRSRPGFGVS